MRVYTKWWLIKELRKDCENHTLNLPVEALQRNVKHSVAREALVLHLASKNKDIGIKLKQRILKYNSILDEAIREKLIHVEKEGTLVDNNTGIVLNPVGRPFFRTTDLGNKFTTYTSLTSAIKNELTPLGLLFGWLITNLVAVAITLLVNSK